VKTNGTDTLFRNRVKKGKKHSETCPKTFWGIWYGKHVKNVYNAIRGRKTILLFGDDETENLLKSEGDTEKNHRQKWAVYNWALWKKGNRHI
jgi:hypothetical protein